MPSLVREKSGCGRFGCGIQGEDEGTATKRLIYEITLQVKSLPLRTQVLYKTDGGSLEAQRSTERMAVPHESSRAVSGQTAE